MQYIKAGAAQVGKYVHCAVYLVLEGCCICRSEGIALNGQFIYEIEHHNTFRCNYVFFQVGLGNIHQLLTLTFTCLPTPIRLQLIWV